MTNDYADLGIHQSIATSIDRDTGLEFDVDVSGNLRGRSLYEQDLYTISVKHNLISTAQKESIELFYTTNKTTFNSFTYDGDDTAYNVYFAKDGAPIYAWIAPNAWKVELKFVGYKA